MITLIEIMLAVLFVVCTGLFFLYKYMQDEMSELNDNIVKISREFELLKSKQRILEQKMIKISNEKDHIEIVHRYDDSEAPKFGGF